jgi:hypothetical protein
MWAGGRPSNWAATRAAARATCGTRTPLPAAPAAPSPPSATSTRAGTARWGCACRAGTSAVRSARRRGAAALRWLPQRLPRCAEPSVRAAALICLQAGGGQLALYNSPYQGPLEGRGYGAGEPALLVAPLGGRLLVFESRLDHEVLPSMGRRWAPRLAGCWAAPLWAGGAVPLCSVRRSGPARAGSQGCTLCLPARLPARPQVGCHHLAPPRGLACCCGTGGCRCWRRGRRRRRRAAIRSSTASCTGCSCTGCSSTGRSSTGTGTGRSCGEAAPRARHFAAASPALGQPCQQQQRHFRGHGPPEQQQHRQRPHLCVGGCL